MNTAQLAAIPTPAPPHSPAPTQVRRKYFSFALKIYLTYHCSQGKHFSPPPPPHSTAASYYPAPPPSHAPYHAPNTFSSPLSALLGTGSHYLFNSESKGPTVQIF